MELNNFKERIQNGRIAPSEGSWGELSERLSSHEKQKKTNKMVWFKYAATIAILLTVGIYFLRPTKNVIERKISTTPILQSPSSKISDATQEIVVAELSTNENKSEVNSEENNSIEAKSIAFSESKNYAGQSDKITGDIESVNNGTNEFQVEEISSEIIIIENKIVTDKEIDVLLKNALLKIEQSDKSIDQSKITGNSLLGEVEYEIEHEYKRKLFEKVIITLNRPKEIELTDRSN